MWIIWTIVIGFVAGVLAKFLTPGDTHEPQGFILTTLLGIAGAFVMTYLGQALGWYQGGQATGFIGATLGAVLILLVWGFMHPGDKPLNSRLSPRPCRYRTELLPGKTRTLYTA